MTYVEELAASVGLHVSTWSPGDGVTRYRFHREPSGYNAGREVKTVLGRKDAVLFLEGVRIGLNS